MVSGFLSGMTVVTKENILQKLWKKTERLLIPYLVTSGIVLLIGSHHFYWFLLSLFELSVLGLFLCAFWQRTRRGKLPNIYVDLGTLAVVYVLLRLTTLFPAYFGFIDSGVVKYFIPFTFGMLMRRYAWIEKLVAGKHTFSCCFLAFIILFGCRYVVDFSQLYQVVTKVDFFFSILALLACISIFNIFMTGVSKRWLDGLAYLGKVSLPIYILHILFVVRIPEIGTWMLGQQQVTTITVQIIYSGAVTFVAIALCILTYKFLRRSWIIRKLLFGES